MSTKRDYYEILGVAKTAPAAEIKSAYRKMALKFHPDTNKAEDAEEKFKEINEAYQVLSDEKKRQTYDQFGHAAFDPAAGMGGNPFGGGYRQGPFTWSYNTSGQNPFSGADFEDPFEIFEQFFGGAFGANMRQNMRRRPRVQVRISFQDSVDGVTREVTIENKKQKVKIPAGIQDGTRIRYDEFEVLVQVDSDSRFKRDGNDLYSDVDLPFTTAALGGEIVVPTLKEELKLKIRPGTQSHTLVRLRGEGMPIVNRTGRGDLYIRLMVSVPAKLDREQKKILKKLAQAGI